MTKDDFLKELYRHLSPLYKKDKDKTISYYQELIADKIEGGESESEIIESLGTPFSIATKIKDELVVKQGVEVDPVSVKKDIFNTFFIILGAPFWFPLLLSLLATIFAVLASFYAVLISLYASSFAVGLYGIVQAIASCFYFGISTPYAFSILGMGLVAIGLSIFLFFATVYLSKCVVKLSKWCIKIIKTNFLIPGGKKNEKY